MITFIVKLFDLDPKGIYHLYVGSQRIYDFCEPATVINYIGSLTNYREIDDIHELKNLITEKTIRVVHAGTCYAAPNHYETIKGA